MSSAPLGPTGLDHETSASIDEAASWLSTQPQWPSPIIPALRQRFALSPVDAVQALREARMKLARPH